MYSRTFSDEYCLEGLSCSCLHLGIFCAIFQKIDKEWLMY